MLTFGAALLSGCAAERPRAAASASVPASLPAEDSAAEAMQLMRGTLARCDRLAGYQIRFHRRERRGLLAPRLGEWEDIEVHFRRQPRSIKMVWRNADSEYDQAVFVEGVNESQVTVLARRGLLGLPASPVSVPPEMAVQLGKSLRPISDFGLAAMVRRTLSQIEEARSAGGARVTLEGVATVEALDAQAHHIVIHYPQGFTRASRQDLYIDVQTGYPDGTYLWLPNGDLLAAYLYDKLLLDVPSDQVFRIDRTSSAKG